MERLFKTTADRAWRYRQSLGDRNVAPAPEAIANLRRFDEPLPAGPTDPEAVIALLDEAGSPATMGSAGGRFFGFVVGSSLPATIAANWMAAAWDQNAGIVVLSPVAQTRRSRDALDAGPVGIAPRVRRRIRDRRH